MYTDTSKTTFIPKAPVTTIQQPTSISGTVSAEKVSSGVGFVGWVGVLLLVATGLSAGGLFLYVGYFQSQQLAIVESLKKQQQLVDTQFIFDAQRLTTRIGYAKDLLQQQIFVSPLFQALHEKTLPSVQFDTFELAEKTQTAVNGQASTGSQYQAILKGKAASYEVIAQQSDVYTSVPALKTHFFHEFKVDTLKRLITFTLTVDIPNGLGHDRFVVPQSVAVDPGLVVVDQPAAEVVAPEQPAVPAE